MKSNAFGLDIGSTSIKAVWLESDGDSFSYKASASVASPSPGIQSESPFDHEELAQVINKLVNDAKISTGNVNIALPDSHIFTKVIEMPPLSDKELSNAIYWEAEQYIPAPLDTMNIDFTILESPKDVKTTEKMQVLLVAAPKLLVKRYQDILQLARLNVVSIEPETLSAIRGVSKNESTLPTLIINVGAMSTSLCIIKSGIIIFNYSFPLGGVALTRAISSDFGFSTEQAEEYKKNYGLSSRDTNIKVSKAIEPIFASILNEVKKAITFYNEKYRDQSPISQILLTGGSAALPGVDVYFVRNIGIETEIANPWKILGIKNVPKDIELNGPSYSVAIGLSVKEYG